MSINAEITKFANDQLSMYNLTNWSFKFNSRKRSAGLCSPSKKTIYVSKYLVDVECGLTDTAKNTVLHEIAHALDFEIRGTSDHGPQWKKLCKIVGANPSRTVNVTINADYKYAIINKETGEVVHKFYRKPVYKEYIAPYVMVKAGFDLDNLEDYLVKPEPRKPTWYSVNMRGDVNEYFRKPKRIPYDHKLVDAKTFHKILEEARKNATGVQFE